MGDITLNFSACMCHMHAPHNMFMYMHTRKYNAVPCLQVQT